MIRFIGLAAFLLLGGCLEAADLAQERLTTPDYCATPDGVTLCEEEDGNRVVRK